MTKVLSPNAPAFHPAYEPVNIAIFNDGVPSMTLRSEEDLSKVLHGIQDDALDESFPLDAAEAAEIEDVEHYVNLMANLHHMEEREERARFAFAHLKKRWAARRANGLVGRPKPARQQHATDPHAAVLNVAADMSRDLVIASEAHRMYTMNDKMQTRGLQTRQQQQADMATKLSKKMMYGGNASSAHVYRNPIQQPRKFN